MTENEAATTFARAGVSILLTNPNLPDNPIVYVNDAFEHAFIGRSEGLLDVRLEDGGGTARVTVTDDGVGLAEGTAWPDMASMGGRIVAGLVDGLDARLHVDTGPKGTRVTLDVPAAMMDS